MASRISSPHAAQIRSQLSEAPAPDLCISANAVSRGRVLDVNANRGARIAAQIADVPLPNERRHIEGAILDKRPIVL